MKNILLLIFFSLAIQCSLSAQKMNRQQYVTKYKQWAIDEMKRTGIPASITLAQGILESDCGNSDLAVDANNHFGIKCHSDWTGETFYKDDDRQQECFRSYDSAYDSFKDHSDFISTKKRYAELFNLEHTDYNGWAYGLKKCGYATEPTYAERLIKIIEEENLSAYDQDSYVPSDDEESVETVETLVADNTTTQDSETQSSTTTNNSTNRRSPTVKAEYNIEPFTSHEVSYNNGTRYIEVQSGDTFESIASEFHMQEWELLKYNDLDHTADINSLHYLYLRPKRNRAHPDVSTYVVENGDTMWDIAHKFGIKLRRLLSKNGMTEGQEPEAGDIIILR